MNGKTLTLPFITKTPNQKEELSYPAELACVVCTAEAQRKKPSFLRDASEKIALISKVYYTMWILGADNECLIIDGLKTSSHEFSFEEPNKTEFFVEELKKNSVNPQKFLDSLKTQAKETKNFASPVNLSFPAMIDDKELLSFLLEYFKAGALQGNIQEETAVIPPETDAKAASETSQAFARCLRTMQADAKGLKYALAVLKEELEFHTNAAVSEIEQLEEKLEVEMAALKLIVDKALKKITHKQDKTIAALHKGIDRKLAFLDRKREKYMRKLQVAEQRKDAVQKKIDTAKKRKSASKSSSGSFALKKYEREVDKTKKEIKASSDELEKFRKEGDNSVKQKQEEFQKAIAQEESKITQLTNAYHAKTDEKQKQIDEMTTHAASLNTNLENRIDELKRRGNALRSEVEVDWKLDDPDEFILAQVPIYLVKYTKAEEERYSLLSPIVIGEEVSVLNELKKMLAFNSEPKLKTLTRPASKKLDETLNTQLLGKMQGDSAFRIKMNEVCRASNLIDLNDFAQTLNEGLDEIEKKGWMTREESATLCRRATGEQT
jgi:hypothetical protein